MDLFLGSASGSTRQQLRNQRYTRLSRDLYVVGDTAVDLRLRSRAALLVMPDAVVCGRTAALLQKLPVEDDGLVHLARHRTAPRSERPGVRVHRTPVGPQERLDLADLADLAVADGPRTFVDLAGELDAESLAVVGDVVLRRYGRAALHEAVARAGRRPGLVLARTVLPLLDGGADSPAETRARLRLHAAGFTALRHGCVIRDEGGGWLAAPDLADVEARVAVQYDGLVHLLGDPRQREQDLQRDELSRQRDWQVVVATARDDRHAHLLVGKVTDAYRRSARLLGRQVLPVHMR